MLFRSQRGNLRAIYLRPLDWDLGWDLGITKEQKDEECSLEEIEGWWSWW